MYIPKIININLEVNHNASLKLPYEDCKYLTSKKMDRLYNNIYKLWNQYRMKKYNIIKYKLNEDTVLKVIEFIYKNIQ